MVTYGDFSKSYSNFANQYNNYASNYQKLFEPYLPFKYKTPKLTSEEARSWADSLYRSTMDYQYNYEIPRNRSIFDRAMDTLSTANYMSAGFTEGVIRTARGDEGTNFFTPLKQAGQGFMAGIGTALGKGRPQHEYTYGKVLGTLGWNPESTFGRIVKGSVGFVGDVLLDPSTYLTGGVSAVVKGTGKVGRAGDALNEVVSKLPALEYNTRYQSLLSKGVSEQRARNGAKLFSDKLAGQLQNVTKLTPEMAEVMIKHDSLTNGYRLSGPDLSRDASRFASEFNKSLGLGRSGDVTWGVRNLPFIGDKLADNMGPLGNTIKLADGDKLRQWADSYGLARSYSDLRFAVYGSQIGKMLSTNAPKVNWAQKDPIQLYKLVSAAEKLVGRDVDKITKQKEFRDTAKAMNLSPAEQKEVISFLERKDNLHKVKAITRLADTQKAKLSRAFFRDSNMGAKITHFDELRNKAQSLDELQREMENLNRSRIEVLKDVQEQAYAAQRGRHAMNDDYREIERRVQKANEDYLSALTRAKTSKDMNAADAEFLSDELNKQIERMVQQNADISAEMRKLRPQIKEEGTRTATASERMQALRSIDEETTAERVRLTREIAQLRKARETTLPREQREARLAELEGQLDSLDARLNIANTSSLQSAFNPNIPDMDLASRIATRVKAVENMQKQADIRKSKGADTSRRTTSDSDVHLAADEIAADKFDTPSIDNLYESVTNDISKFIFGKPGMVSTIRDFEAHREILRMITDGVSPATIQRLPAINNNKFLTDRAMRMYQHIANELGYKSFDRDVLKRTKALEKKSGVKVGDFDVARDYDRLSLDEKQEYARLIALDQRRSEMVARLSSMSDEEFNRMVSRQHYKRLSDDIEETVNGLHGYKEVGRERETNPKEFMDDFISEMRKLGNTLSEKDRPEFFDKVLNKFRAPRSKFLGVDDGRVVGSDPNWSKERKADLFDGGDYRRDEGLPPFLLAELNTTLKTKFGARPYHELSSAEQIALHHDILRNVMSGEKQNQRAKLLTKRALDRKAFIEASARNRTTRIEKVRETVNEGTVVDVKTLDNQRAVVLARKDTDTDTFYDVMLFDDRKIVRVTPAQITGPVGGKVYDPASIVKTKAVQEAIGDKKSLRAEMDSIREQMRAVRSGNAPMSAREEALIKKLGELDAQQAAKLESLSDMQVPTKKYERASARYDKLESERATNRKELAKLRKQLPKVKEQALRDTEIAERTFKTTKGVLDDELARKVAWGERNKTRLDRLAEEFDVRIAELDKFVEKHAQKMEELQEAQRNILAGTGHDSRASMVAELEKIHGEVASFDRKLRDADVLEDYIRTYIESTGRNYEKFAQDVIDEESGLNALLKTIDDSPLSEKQKEWAKLVRTHFFRAGLDEVKIGKLTPQQFESMAGKYVYHMSTPEMNMYKTRLEEELGHSSPTQDYGFGVKWGEFTKSRTNDMTIDEFNDFMQAELKGNKAFSDDLAELYLARMLKHEELMYDNKVMETFATRFGQPYKVGDQLLEGHQVYGNFGKLRELFAERAKISMKEELQVENMVARAKGVRETDYTEEVMRAKWERHVEKVVNQYGFDMGIMEGKTLPLVELTEEQIKRLDDTGLAFQLNKDIGERANISRKIKMQKDENRLLQVYDRFLHWIKLNQTAVMPAFHIKNKYSNLFQEWLAVGRDAFDPKMHINALKAVSAEGDWQKMREMPPLVTNDGQVFHWDDLYDTAIAHGVIDEGFFARDLSGMTESKGLLGKWIPSRLDPTSTQDFALYKFATKYGGRIENGDRMVIFASALKQGKSIDEASDLATKYLFDYSDLTSFERTWMKRIFPYYTWIRKNGRLQVGEFIEQPQKYALIAKIHNAYDGSLSEEERVDRTYLPGFAQDWIQTPFFTTNGNGQRVPVMLNPNMPYMDLARLPDLFNPVDSAREWFGMTSPIGKVPLELATNYNAFFNANIVDEDSESPTMDRLKHIVTQTGWGSAAVNILGGDNPDTVAFHLVNTLLGVKFMNHNEQYARDMFLKGLRQGNSDLGRAANDYVEEIRTRVGSGIQYVQGSIADTLKDSAVALFGAPPASPLEYSDSLAPISRDTYEELPEAEKRKYQPPTKEEVSVFHKEALRMQEEAYEDAGQIKRFVWTLLDATNDINDKEVLRVESVSDGDTFTVKRGNEFVDVRLLLVDTPESVDPRIDTPMPMSKEASEFTSTMLLGRDVVLHGTKRDKYGRLLAFVELDGNDFNKLLLEEGLATLRYLEESGSYDKLTEYREAEQRAFEQEAGIWQHEGYAVPGVDGGYFRSAWDEP